MKAYKLIASYQKNRKDDWEEINKILKLTYKEIQLACENLQEYLKQQQEKGTIPKGFYHYPCLYKATKEDLKKK